MTCVVSIKPLTLQPFSLTTWSGEGTVTFYNMPNPFLSNKMFKLNKLANWFVLLSVWWISFNVKCTMKPWTDRAFSSSVPTSMIDGCIVWYDSLLVQSSHTLCFHDTLANNINGWSLSLAEELIHLHTSLEIFVLLINAWSEYIWYWKCQNCKIVSIAHWGIMWTCLCLWSYVWKRWVSCHPYLYVPILMLQCFYPTWEIVNCKIMSIVILNIVLHIFS